MIDFIIESHWRNIAAVNPGHKVKEDITKTRVQRFVGYTLQSMDERTQRRNNGRYPTNIISEEMLHNN